jgi:hypothetical protein
MFEDIHVFPTFIINKLHPYSRIIRKSILESRILKIILCRYPLGQQFNTDLTWAYAKWNKNIMSETGLGIPLNISEFTFDTSIC